MEIQKLTPEQIEKLFVFTRQHYVEWYDLQLELVDHLANAIEEQWQKSPKVSFDEALKIEFKKFGIFGFEDVIEKKRIALTKVYNKFIWQNIKDFFTISNTIVTFSIVLLLFQLLSIVNVFKYIFFVGIIGVIIIAIWLYFKSKKIKKQSKKIDNKKWLLEDIINRYGNTFGILVIIPQLLNHVNYIESIYLRLLSSFFATAILIFLYIIMVKIPSKSQDYLKSTYPEYELDKI